MLKECERGRRGEEKRMCVWGGTSNLFQTMSNFYHLLMSRVDAKLMLGYA